MMLPLTSTNSTLASDDVLSPFSFAIYLYDNIDYRRYGYFNILLLSQSICEFQKPLLACQRQLFLQDGDY
jgi:hypothetical protein